jgi:site-specific DNA-methyltransferase (adenine-specific)
MKTDTLDLRHMDCMELMSQYPDKHFDLAVVDPPYDLQRFKKSFGTTRFKSDPRVAKEGIAWDNAPSPKYWNELFRVSSNQIVWGANNFTMPPSEYFCIWNKKQTVDNFATAEYAWVSMGLKTPAKIFEYSIHQHNADGGKVHPTQKPVALYNWIFANYAEKGMKILDTHMGSGSIAIAAHYAGMHLTACELDEDYFKAACERIERETSQTTFF